MTALRRTMLGLIMILIMGAALFLMTWNEPPPIERIDMTIPDDQLPR